MSESTLASKNRKRRKSSFREMLESVLIALFLFLLIRTFVVQAFRIPSPSMEETLLIGDFLFINKIEYGPQVPFTNYRLPGLRAPRQGDIIVFRYPGSGENGEPAVDYIKRCVAVGGQIVEIKGKELFVDGTLQLEPYVIHTSNINDPIRDNFGPLEVPEGHLFMMGDNRDNSADSRFWGTLPMDNVRGRAFVRYFSWEDNGRLWDKIQKKKVRWERILTPII